MSLNKAGELLIPPEDNTASKALKRWRLVIAGVVFLLVVNGLSGRGLIGGFGAYAAGDDVKTILTLQLAKELRDLQKQMCELPVGQRVTLESVIENYQIQYIEVTGKRYPLVPCKS